MLCYGPAIKSKSDGDPKVLKKLACGLAAAFSFAVLAVPADAQGYSDSYRFLKAVREGDGAEVDKFLDAPGPSIVNTRDSVSGETALHIVTSKRNLGWLGVLMGKGARVDAQNKEGYTPLGMAAQVGWLEGAQALLARKAKVDLANSRGETPLILAVQKRDLAMVRLLLGHGADPRKPDRVTGQSALDYAKRDARSAVILKLLEAPASPVKKAQGPGL